MGRGGARIGAGRPRKTNRELELIGKGFRAHKDEATNPAGTPDKPLHVSARAVASEEWDRLVPLVVARRTMSPLYLATMAAYCTCYADYVESELSKSREGFTRWVQDVTIDGAGQEHIKLRPHPALKESRDAQREMRAHAQQLGITPATTTRVKADGGQQPKDWLEELKGPSEHGEDGNQLH